jgi:hypothetical protein
VLGQVGSRGAVALPEVAHLSPVLPTKVKAGCSTPEVQAVSWEGAFLAQPGYLGWVSGWKPASGCVVKCPIGL